MAKLGRKVSAVVNEYKEFLQILNSENKCTFSYLYPSGEEKMLLGCKFLSGRESSFTFVTKAPRE